MFVRSVGLVVAVCLVLIPVGCQSGSEPLETIDDVLAEHGRPDQIATMRGKKFVVVEAIDDIDVEDERVALDYSRFNARIWFESGRIDTVVALDNSRPAAPVSVARPPNPETSE